MPVTPAPGAPASAPAPAPAPEPVPPANAVRPVFGDQAPWFVPDARGWVGLGLFVLAAYAMTLLAYNPRLEDNKLFFAIATGLFGGGGLLAVIGFYFVASKRSADRGGGQ